VAKEIVEEIKVSIESCTVTKVDVNDPAQRALVDNYWGKTRSSNSAS
jgi:hypothetical protein